MIMQNFPICTLIEEESRGELKLMMRKLDSGEPGKPKLNSPSYLNTDYSDDELRFMYENGQGHLTLFCIVFV